MSRFVSLSVSKSVPISVNCEYRNVLENKAFYCYFISITLVSANPEYRGGHFINYEYIYYLLRLSLCFDTHLVQSFKNL